MSELAATITELLKETEGFGDEQRGEIIAKALVLNRRAPAEPSRVLGDDELREALNRPTEAAQLPALIMANIEDVPGWQDSTALVTAHCHARVLHEDSPAEPSAGWRGIESAPRDGRVILAFGGGLEGRIDMVSYNLGIGCWDCSEVTLDDRDGEAEGYSRPTHWMPLPSPPSEAEGSDQP